MHDVSHPRKLLGDLFPVRSLFPYEHAERRIVMKSEFRGE